LELAEGAAETTVDEQQSSEASDKQLVSSAAASSSDAAPTSSRTGVTWDLPVGADEEALAKEEEAPKKKLQKARSFGSRMSWVNVKNPKATKLPRTTSSKSDGTTPNGTRVTSPLDWKSEGAVPSSSPEAEDTAEAAVPSSSPEAEDAVTMIV
jgi:hypothetical protein